MTRELLLIGAFIIMALNCCSQPVDSNAILKKKMEEYKRTIPATIKNQESEEWIENVYRNRVYKFRIEFPKDWEYGRGTSPSTLARALNRNYGATFSVSVKHLPDNEKKVNDIYESMSPTDLKNQMSKMMSLQNIKPEKLEVEKAALNNFPAYFIHLTHLESSGTRSYVYLSRQIQCYHDSKIYTVSFNLPEELNDSEMDTLFFRVVDSFKFEFSY